MLPGVEKVFPESSEVSSRGHLVVGGCDALDLAAEYGTPLYLFDEEMLRNQCQGFLREFPSRHPDTSVVYACKAYVNPSLARIFMEEGLSLDVVSGGELAVARAVDYPPERVCFHGNNKGRQELEEALAWNIGCVAVDSFHEMELLDRLAGEAGKVQEILVRVSPGVDPHTHVHTTTGTLDSKFGFPIETGQAGEAVRRALRMPNLKLVGLHFHLGSPIFHVEPYQTAMEIVLEFAS